MNRRLARKIERMEGLSRPADLRPKTIFVHNPIYGPEPLAAAEAEAEAAGHDLIVLRIVYPAQG